MALKDINKEALDDVDVLLSTIDQLFSDVKLEFSDDDIKDKNTDREKPTAESLLNEGYAEPQIDEIF